MNILDNLERATTHRRRSGVRPIELSIISRPTGVDRLGQEPGYAMQQQYQLRAVFGVNYWANPAQVEDASRLAKRVLASTMYSDVIAELHTIAHAVSDGDVNEALAMLASLQDYLSGGER